MALLAETRQERKLRGEGQSRSAVTLLYLDLGMIEKGEDSSYKGSEGVLMTKSDFIHP